MVGNKLLMLIAVNGYFGTWAYLLLSPGRAFFRIGWAISAFYDLATLHAKHLLFPRQANEDSYVVLRVRVRVRHVAGDQAAGGHDGPQAGAQTVRLDQAQSGDLPAAAELQVVVEVWPGRTPDLAAGRQGRRFYHVDRSEQVLHHRGFRVGDSHQSYYFVVVLISCPRVPTGR